MVLVNDLVNDHVESEKNASTLRLLVMDAEGLANFCTIFVKFYLASSSINIRFRMFERVRTSNPMS